MLTGKQERFARLVAEGTMPQWACYDEAYDAEKSSRRTMRDKASKLMARDDIRTTVEAIRAGLADDTALTLEGHAKELHRLKGVAEAGNNFGAAVRSEELRGKVAGFYVERVRNEPPEELSVEELCTVDGQVVAEAVRHMLLAAELLESARRDGILHLVPEVG